jgi:hypothetical protein
VYVSNMERSNECRKSGTLCFEVHKEKGYEGCHAPPDLKTTLSRF